MAESKKAVKEKVTKKKPESEKSQTKKETSDKVKVEATPNGKEQDGSIQESAGTTVQANSEERQVKPVAKAGKRSEKALKEAEEKQAKEQRKAEESTIRTDEDPKPKTAQKPARSILERKGKKFRKAAEQLETGKSYGLKEALQLAASTSPVKFDATVEMHLRLGVDPRQADQNLRDTIVLPAGTGKTLRVAVFANPEGVASAKKAGADVSGSEEFLQQLEKGTINFDILIATPAMMGQLGKYARLLGPKGLMPNPKSGTVTNDVAKAVKEAKAGRLEYRVDSTGIVHAGIGKVSFGGEKLLQNGQALLDSIKSNRPASLKSAYIKSVFVTTSMGPSISVEVNGL